MQIVLQPLIDASNSDISCVWSDPSGVKRLAFLRWYKATFRPRYHTDESLANVDRLAQSMITKVKEAFPTQASLWKMLTSSPKSLPSHSTLLSGLPPSLSTPIPPRTLPSPLWPATFTLIPHPSPPSPLSSLACHLHSHPPSLPSHSPLLSGLPPPLSSPIPPLTLHSPLWPATFTLIPHPSPHTSLSSLACHLHSHPPSLPSHSPLLSGLPPSLSSPIPPLTLPSPLWPATFTLIPHPSPHTPLSSLACHLHSHPPSLPAHSPLLSGLPPSLSSPIPPLTLPSPLWPATFTLIPHPSPHTPLSSLACHLLSSPIPPLTLHSPLWPATSLSSPVPPLTLPSPLWLVTITPISPSRPPHFALCSGPTTYNCLQIYTGVAIPAGSQEYHSRVTHFVRANPSHHGDPWFSHVAISGGEEVWYAEVLLLFKHAQSDKGFAYVQYYEVVGNDDATGCKRLEWAKYPRTRSLYRDVVEVDSVFRAVHIVESFKRPGTFFLNDYLFE
ncbi:unnamed protein product [Closterium sp. NIES-65]|nr:unnamed protein product [Closterium sp. NIES-65]